MSDRLLETTIGEVCEVFDGPHATPAKTSSGPIFLGITTLNKGRIDLSEKEHLSEADFRKWTRRVTPRAGDVVFSYETKLGEAAIIPEGLRCCLGRRMALMRPREDKIYSRFLLYYFLGPEFQDVIRQRKIHGSTVERLALIEFPKFPLRLPNIAEQRMIAKILGALDDKIELNRRINETLEALAQTLFKSWFVDFDPVVAKAAGRKPTDLRPDILASFPATFQDSAFGRIPKGWEVRMVSEIYADLFDGPHATPAVADSGPLFLGIKNLTGTRIDLNDVLHIAESDFPKWTRRVTPRENDIVFSYEATLGFFALVPPGLRCCLGRRLALIRCRPELTHFLFHTFTADRFQTLIQSFAWHGSTVDRTPLTEFGKYPILWPGERLAREFGTVVKHLWAMIHHNDNESRTLATLRDALLPKLLSGELKVPIEQTNKEEIQ